MSRIQWALFFIALPFLFWTLLFIADRNTELNYNNKISKLLGEEALIIADIRDLGDRLYPALKSGASESATMLPVKIAQDKQLVDVNKRLSSAQKSEMQDLRFFNIVLPFYKTTAELYTKVINTRLQYNQKTLEYESAISHVSDAEITRLSDEVNNLYALVENTDKEFTDYEDKSQELLPPYTMRAISAFVSLVLLILSSIQLYKLFSFNRKSSLLGLLIVTVIVYLGAFIFFAPFMFFFPNTPVILW